VALPTETDDCFWPVEALDAVLWETQAPMPGLRRCHLKSDRSMALLPPGVAPGEHCDGDSFVARVAPPAPAHAISCALSLQLSPRRRSGCASALHTERSAPHEGTTLCRTIQSRCANCATWPRGGETVSPCHRTVGRVRDSGRCLFDRPGASTRCAIFRARTWRAAQPLDLATLPAAAESHDGVRSHLPGPS